MRQDASRCPELCLAMDRKDPNDFIALRQTALSVEAQLQALANVFRLAVQGVKQPETITTDEVRLLCEAVLKHLKPSISVNSLKS